MKTFFTESLIDKFTINDKVRFIYDKQIGNTICERGDEGVVVTIESFSPASVSVQMSNKQIVHVDDATIFLEKATTPKDEFVFIKSFPDVADTSVDYYYNLRTQEVKVVHDTRFLGDGGIGSNISSFGDVESELPSEVVDNILKLDPELREDEGE